MPDLIAGEVKYFISFQTNGDKVRQQTDESAWGCWERNGRWKARRILRRLRVEVPLAACEW